MELRPWQREVLKFSKEIIGTVKTSLVGDRSEESTLGNFVTDAIVYYVSTEVLIRNILGENERGTVHRTGQNVRNNWILDQVGWFSSKMPII